MNTIARILLFFLLATASAVTLATDRKGDAGEARTDRSASRGDTTPAATPAPAVQEQKSPETRKPKRCRTHHKTVGIACRKPASR